MARRQRNVGLEILEGLRQLKRGEHGRITTVPAPRLYFRSRQAAVPAVERTVR